MTITITRTTNDQGVITVVVSHNNKTASTSSMSEIQAVLFGQPVLANFCHSYTRMIIGSISETVEFSKTVDFSHDSMAELEAALKERIVKVREFLAGVPKTESVTFTV